MNGGLQLITAAVMLFIHSSFRVSSTWLWTRFRSLADTVAYYEIFNEQLGTLTPLKLIRLKPDTWSSHHPAAEPYYLEYLPLLQSTGGVAHYSADMAYSRFIPVGGLTGSLSEAELLYIDGLITNAESLGKTPVLTATRSLGRLSAIKAAVPGFHILLYRNLFQQWCSYVDQAAHGNPYFLQTVGAVLKTSQHDPFLGHLNALFRLDRMPLTSSVHFYCFVLLHLYLYAHAFAAADLLLDVNRLARDAEYRAATEQRIAAASGLPVSLAGATDSVATSFAKQTAAEELVAEFAPLIGMVSAAAPSEAARCFIAQLFAEFVEEYARYPVTNQMPESDAAAAG